MKTQPTIGSNVEQIKHDNLQFEVRRGRRPLSLLPQQPRSLLLSPPAQVWDLGGQANLRPSWAQYFTATDAVIVVVDSTDRARVGIVRGELQTLLRSEHLAKACILIYANKQDLPDAMPVAELSEALELVTIKTHNWHVQQSCAVTGEGLLDGLQWIAQRLRNSAKPAAAPP